MNHTTSNRKSYTLAWSCVERITLFGAIILMTSCNHNSVAPPTYYPQPTIFRHSTFPLAISNQWVYADSSFEFGGPNPILVQLIMANIGDYSGRTDHGGWNFNNIPGLQGGPTGQYSISNDTVYLYTWFNGALLNPRIAFLPAAALTDTVTFIGPWTWSQTKAYALGHNMVTPAGNFDSVYVYECDPDNIERYLTYFRPGIGVICSETYSATSLGSGSTAFLSDRSVLIAYDLVK
jgi:hypothetical protein